ncbi:AMSH-like protease sst2 [Trichoderma asperellum]|uniref:AMSH-like protease sst2 n=1 Tax=Trichoderma asperellum TaxID=101201 RepID=A0A6V8QQ74_TRIAP|nr:AMSH-like protease sst2 [Trichoderma asperellum]
MEARPNMAPARPQSVKELVAQAENFAFNVNIAMKHWIRAADTLYQEASFALSDGDFGRAYMMLYRHSVLVLKFLPTHPQFKDPDNKKAFKSLSKRIDRVIKDLEQLKPEIQSAYKEWEHTASSPAAEGPIYEQEANIPVTPSNYYYPSLSKSRPVDYEQSQHTSSREPQPLRPPKEHFDVPPPRYEDKLDNSEPAIPPQVPRKTYLGDYPSLDATPRPLVDITQPPLPPKESVQVPQPKKERLAFKPGGYLENGDPVRSIFLPGSLRSKFLEIASKNTAAGLETCGVLCGTPINNALFVRCLLIPDQKSTPDTYTASFDSHTRLDLTMF